jgi:hypothetical protein
MYTIHVLRLTIEKHNFHMHFIREKNDLHSQRVEHLLFSIFRNAKRLPSKRFRSRLKCDWYRQTSPWPKGWLSGWRNRCFGATYAHQLFWQNSVPRFGSHYSIILTRSRARDILWFRTTRARICPQCLNDCNRSSFRFTAATISRFGCGPYILSERVRWNRPPETRKNCSGRARLTVVTY